jgi:two-component system nitrogen regulation sensor histidine kinase NtrY
MIRTLRGRILLVFLGATLPPLLLTLQLSLNLLDRSLAFRHDRELDELSRSLRTVGRAYYRARCEQLRKDALEGRDTPRRYTASAEAAWPAEVREFHDSPDAERFRSGGTDGNTVEYLARRGDEVLLWSAPLGEVALGNVSRQYSQARAIVEHDDARDLRRGFFSTFLLVSLSVWLLSLAALMYWTWRLSRPIRQLSAGLAEVGQGNLEYAIAGGGDDEIGSVVRGFNHMTAHLRDSRNRLLYAARMESWQALARKMAHEIKNSLTPIRLTMEEIAARRQSSDPEFLQQAAQIVVDEVTTLERRVRAFSEFAGEPPVCPQPVDVSSLLEERITLLRSAHPDVTYAVRVEDQRPLVYADEDLVKGILTNLLENAAQAAPGGRVVGVVGGENGAVKVEVHDSGPGLSALARSSLFEPSISFKQGGMGLGLSIARRGAVLSGGDIELIPGELGGAAFRVSLPRAH